MISRSEFVIWLCDLTCDLTCHLVVQLVVLQLSNIYSIQIPTLLRVYLRICLLERYFDHIEYQHIPIYLNILTDALDNYVLDRHLNHL
jgi:hypothetical protein